MKQIKKMGTIVLLIVIVMIAGCTVIYDTSPDNFSVSVSDDYYIRYEFKETTFSLYIDITVQNLLMDNNYKVNHYVSVYNIKDIEFSSTLIREFTLHLGTATSHDDEYVFLLKEQNSTTYPLYSTISTLIVTFIG